MKENTNNITSDIQKRHNNCIKEINEIFPEIIYVGKCYNGAWAKLTYPNLGLGIACFLSHMDSNSWRNKNKKQKLELVEMTKEDAIKIAKKENLTYLHLLSNDNNHPLQHLQIS